MVGSKLTLKAIKELRENFRILDAAGILGSGPCYVISRYTPKTSCRFMGIYRDRLKGMYVVARNFFLLLLNFSAWPCLDVA